MLNLTPLEQGVIKAILDDTLLGHIRLSDLAINPPRPWEEQRLLVR
jgi:hypothetical protein